jgi:predicted amidohydrolase YtcJ
VDEIAADRILLNGRILGLGSGRPPATAIAIAGGTVAAVGGREIARASRGRRTHVIDLRGATVVPGLVDAHAHLDREGLKEIYPSLAGCRSLEDLTARLRRLAARRPAGQWLVTMPLGTPPFYRDAPALAERRWPTRGDLDAAVADRPVYIRGIWGYWNRPPVYSVANSAALAAAGITRDTVPPKGVEILKDGAGEPTGVFVEHNLIQVLEMTLLRCVPRFTHDERMRALVVSQQRYAARGVTAVYEGHGVAPEILRVYRETHAAGRLRLRCTLALSPTWTDASEAEDAIPALAAWAGGEGLGDEHLRVSGICLHWGGDAEVARILHAAQPYTGWAGFVESSNDPGAYRTQAALAARHGLRVNTLVTRCLPEVLDAWEAIDAVTPIRALRWVLVHLNVATPRDIARIRRLGAVVTTNPISYLWRSAAEEVARAGGAADRLLPHRSLWRGRIPFGLATDNKPPDPWMALAAVVGRRDMTTGEVLGPDERLSRVQGLAALTTGGAAVTFTERAAGTLAPGRRADLAVLEGDPLRVSLDELAAMPVRLTLVGGEVVHGDG